MLREAGEAPAVRAEQIHRNHERAEAGAYRRRCDRSFVATLARGSSDRAAMFGKVLLETRVQVPTLSHAPSIGRHHADLVHLGDERRVTRTWIGGASSDHD